MLALACALVSSSGCRPALPPGKPLTALTTEEEAGHVVFEKTCAGCHAAYTTQGLHGPSLLSVLRKPYLPSGAPANDSRVTAVVLHGRGLMPAFGNILDEQQLQALLAYLHTL